MLQRKPIVIAATAGVILVLGALFFFWPEADEKIINRNLSRIVELAEKTGNESPIITIGQSREIVRYIAQDPMVQIGPPLPVITDRRELEGVVMQVRQTLQTLSIRIVRKNLTLADDRQTARMELEAEANVSYAGESGRERRRFTIDWVKEEGDWLVQAVRLEGAVNFQF
jgi:hypothetical protein